MAQRARVPCDTAGLAERLRSGGSDSLEETLPTRQHASTRGRQGGESIAIKQMSPDADG